MSEQTRIERFPMRIISIGSTARVLCIVAASSVAGPAQLSPREGAQPGAVLAPRVSRSLDSDEEIVGLSKASRPALLTWERIYALALVRARARRGAFSESLDPAALAAEAAQFGVADFAGFRALFVADGPTGNGALFRDPSAAVLELQRRLQAIDNARGHVAVRESLVKMLQERVQGESAGLSRSDIDMVSASLDTAGQKVAEAITQFRDELDKLKVALGLRPRAPVILDRESLAAFRSAFDSLEAWARRPNRSLEELPEFIGRLPALGEVVVDGQPILAKLEMNPNNLEDVLTTVAQLAIKNRGDRNTARPPLDAGVQLELRVRRRIRGLFATSRAYEAEKRTCELATRLKDQTFERLRAPPAGASASRSSLVQALLDQDAQLRQAKDRLVALWTSFRSERLTLYRDLGALPHNDWKSFYADLSAGSAAAGEVPAVPPKPAAAGDASAIPRPPVPPPPASAPVGREGRASKDSKRS